MWQILAQLIKAAKNNPEALLTVKTAAIKAYIAAFGYEVICETLDGTTKGFGCSDIPGWMVEKIENAIDVFL